ncbi:Elongator complex protein 5 like protein [Argiope bruennichi]|uniref:Elongator complex protein 5 n=1 Tax=Argiope bruennichi TaxID=94029 RepID=A0A8T0FT63_ARGBR|nr:Elongator complex protein 5 like protein [Argiope bruennichi]
MYLTKEPLFGNGKAKFILVKDSSDLRGLKIFKTLLKMYCKEKAAVVVLSYDGIGEDLIHGVTQNKDDIKLLDIFSDPYGWYQGENLNTLMSVDFIPEYFSDFEGVLCIYSLTSLLIHDGIVKVYKTLHKLLKNNADLQILALLHPSVHDLQEIDIIDKMSSTSLNIDSDEDTEILQSIVHNSSGKVNSLSLEYKISENFEFSSLVDVQLLKKKELEKKPDPTANLTFNLKLKDDEKEARNQLQLPYMKMQNSDDAVIQNLLENDFYDEEDPDDDLDI